MRRSSDRLRFRMGIPIPVRRYRFVNRGPGHNHNKAIHKRVHILRNILYMLHHRYYTHVIAPGFCLVIYLITMHSGVWGCDCNIGLISAGLWCRPQTADCRKMMVLDYHSIVLEIVRPDLWMKRLMLLVKIKDVLIVDTVVQIQKIWFFFIRPGCKTMVLNYQRLDHTSVCRTGRH